MTADPASTAASSPSPAASGGPGRRGLLWGLLAAALPPLLVGLAGAASPATHFRYDDNLARVYPAMATACEVALQGHLPLWNPYALCGARLVPDLAAAALYPLNLPIYLACGRDAARLAAVWPLVHLAVAGLGAFVLARRLGRREPAALLAALAFAGGAPLLFPARAWAAIGLSAAWTPWVLAAAVAAARGRRWAVLAGGLAVALQVAMNGAEAAAYAGALAVLLPAVLAREVGERPWPAAGRGLTVVVVGGLLSAPVVLPVLSAIAGSHREGVIAGGATVPLVGLAGAFFPGLPAPGPYQPVVVTSWLFAGLLPTVLAAAAPLLAGWSPRRVLWAAAGALAVWASLGAALGAEAVLTRLPLLHLFHHPMTKLHVFGLAVALLGAEGLELWSAAPPARRRRLAVVLGGLALLASAPAFAWGPLPLADLWQLPAAGLSLAALGLAPRRWLAGAALALTALWIGLGAALYWVAPSPYLPRVEGPPLLNPGPGRRLAALSEGELQRLPVEVGLGRAWGGPYRTPVVNHYAAFVRPEHARLFGLDKKGAVLDPARTGAILAGSFPEAAGIRWVSAAEALGPDDLPPRYRRVRATLHPIPGEAPLPHRLYENPRWVGLAYFVEAARRVPVVDPARLGEVDLLRETLVAGEGPPEAFAPGEVLGWREAPGRVEVEVRPGDGPGLLVVAVTHDPGWSARVDGQPTVVREVLGGLAAVEVPAGAARVVLAYRDRAFEAGILLALLGGLAAAGWALLSARRARAGG